MGPLRPESLAEDLTPLLRQNAGISWPTENWPGADPYPIDPQRFENLTQALFDLPDGSGVTYALLIFRNGQQLYERYAAGASAFYLQFDGRHDTGAYAAAKPLAHEPGAHFSYSSGSTNIICRILRDGLWEDRRILPAGWVDYARSCSYLSDEEGYGAHWWLRPDRPDWFYASGYDGQRLLLVPDKDLIVVRCGRTDVDHIAPVWENLYALADLF